MEGAMDFQSLSRRELQALCKKNKIPANMTNVAMADALRSLQHVEGIEELIKPDESENQQSPEKLMSVLTSMDVPRTVCRTSTRRKPIKDEPESSQPLTRTRGGTRRRITEDAPQTPAVASSRKRAPVVAASARQKTESLVCSTRRSVRLAEKKMSELSLNEKGKTQPIKIDDFSKEMLECLEDAQENKSLSGADTQEVSEEGSEWTNDLEVVLDQNSKEELESARDSKDVKCEVTSVLSGEKGSIVEEGSHEEIMGVDLHTKLEVGCEATDESYVSCCEKLENAIKHNLDDEMKPVEKTGCDDFPVTIVLCDIENSSGDLGLENEKELSIDRNNCVDLVPLSEESENSGCFIESKEPELNSSNASTYDDQVQNPEVACPNLANSNDTNENEADGHGTQELDSEFGIQAESDGKVSGNFEEEVVVNEIEAFDSVALTPLSDDNDKVEKAIMTMTDECPPPFDDTPSPMEIHLVSNAIVTDEIPSSTLIADPIPENEIGEEEFDLATIEHLPTMDNSPTSVKKISPRPLVSNEELKGEIPFSNWAVDQLMGHIPRPPQLTPRKSSSMKPTALPRMNDLLDYNKENVDNNDVKMCTTDNTSTPLDKKSLRQLRKMLKGIQLTSNMKNDDLQNVVQQQELGKARPALQALPENQA